MTKGNAQTPSTPFEKYYKKAQEDTLSLPTRKRLLKIAYESLKHTSRDSLKHSRLSKLAVTASSLGDILFFEQLSKEGLALAQYLNNASLEGDTHWNYGSYYLDRKRFDSSYAHYNSAYKLFTNSKNKYYAGKMLYNMAFIRSETNDFTGAEILLFRAIKLFDKEKKPKQLYLCYNLLGTNADDMEEYGKALEYYQKAGEFLPKIKDRNYFQLELWNNMGVRLQKLEEHARALPYFNRALSHTETLVSFPALLSKLLDNKAYSYVQMGHVGKVKPLMDRAIKLRDSIGDTPGAVVSRIRFAGYYAKKGDTLAALESAQEAFRIAEKNHLTRDVLQALELLAELNPSQKGIYLQKHIELDRSLNARDRNLRNKYTAIAYETEKYMQENERLFNQRLWITVGAATLTLLLLLIYWNARQRARNKELLFQREQ